MAADFFIGESLVGEGNEVAHIDLIPKTKADDYCILVGVFIHWEAADDKKINKYNYQATKESAERALKGKPTVDDVLSAAKTATHPFAGGADK